MLELPNAEARIAAVDHLWKRTEGYMVLIEEGTNAGYEVKTDLATIAIDTLL